MSENTVKVTKKLPVLPLRDVVVFPFMVIPLFVGRKRSIKALEIAMAESKSILLVAQKSADDDDPRPNGLYSVATMANILQMLKMPDGTVKLLVEGQARAKVLSYVAQKDKDAALIAEIELYQESQAETVETRVMQKNVIEIFQQYVKTHKKIPKEVVESLNTMDSALQLADTIAAHLNVNNHDKQKILAELNIDKRLERILVIMESQMDIMVIEKKIRSRVKGQMEKNQREYYLNEQMKAIQKELGEMDEKSNEIKAFSDRIQKSGMPKEAKEKMENELNKLKLMSPMAAEAAVIRNYIDWALSVPWKKRSKISNDIHKSQVILDADHYGLERVKEYILEYLAVQSRVQKSKAAILCLVGPPGVGKTSLGESIARATNRKFVRMSLGGVRDEAEIRGHRRTYIGSMPGKIIQNLAKVKTKNPLFLLDEIDKMSMDFRGDPASALLEVLDPAQNDTFVDHYLEVEYDLSEVMFVATANSMNIPGPLLDRMEVIRLSGYTQQEKFEIAKKYLVPKQQVFNGLKEKEYQLPDNVIKDIISSYTREAGVRGLEREISKLFRKAVKQILLENDKQVRITPKNLENYLGPKRYIDRLAEDNERIGQVNGMAWTEVGGELLTVEASILTGKGNHLFTGKLGEVMQESIRAAISVIRSRYQHLNIAADFYQDCDIHVHVPEGAIPKDGPSAGIAMCTAIISALTKVPVRSDVAMTGEITLRGSVLRIGGLKEKVMAAHRLGIKTIVIPVDNERDLHEIPKSILKALTIKPVKWIDEVIDLALVSPLAKQKPVDLALDDPAKIKKQDEDTAHSTTIAH